MWVLEVLSVIYPIAVILYIITLQIRLSRMQKRIIDLSIRFNKLAELFSTLCDALDELLPDTGRDSEVDNEK